ncbi:DUF4839 domain-containing protein [Nocardioides zeae]|uniref:DUF4839 domain-containing protein n=1 Tax=Nocardioides zeae TaxID=1457234 RepID=A0AAJ1U3T2_9ACTN|nr:DUF4839 domain-containing protein [Nocardioides zeae]MDQ1103742.1 hypothetical protein [Nocardioides zeae]
MNNNLRYESKTVQAIRGTESKVAAKWAGDGWELIAEDRGVVRTSLTFRRARPPVPWRLVATGGAGLVALALVIGVIVAFTAGGGTTNPSSSASPASTTDNGQDNQSGTTSPPSTPTSLPSAAGPLTAATSPEFAALLVVNDYCDPSIGAFAAQNAGAILEFDASINSMTKHGSYDTRYDILVAAGDAGTSASAGPAFKFEDVGLADLNLAGDYPEAIGEGDLLRVTATVGPLDQAQCLFYLDPVETLVR